MRASFAIISNCFYSVGESVPDSLERNIHKDVTILIARIGDYKSNSKVKWIDFAPEFHGNNSQNEYRVYIVHFII